MGKRKRTKPLESSEVGASNSKVVRKEPAEQSSENSCREILEMSESSALIKTKHPDIDELVKTFKEVSKSIQSSEIEIPDTVNIMKFAECRANEIATMMKEIQLKRPKQALQQLPHYMRRRAASHNANRVPRRLREKVAREICKAKKTKRPSRKHRRRPSNLLLEYHRRARSNIWLETHIWFAKRFKLEKLWGYYIPIHPKDKNERSSYRSATQHAFLQDLSYLCCLELKGPQDLLLSKLSKLTNSSIGLTFSAKAFIHGKREGSTFLYYPDSFPFCAIGPVTFLWQPLDMGQNSSEKPEHKLWIWYHPTMHKELVKILSFLFDLQKVPASIVFEDIPDEASVQEEQSEANTSARENVNATSSVLPKAKKSDKSTNNKLKKNILKEVEGLSAHSVEVSDVKFINRFKKYICFESENVKLTILKDSLVRYRLIGPRSQSVIANVLMPADVSYTTECKNGDKMWWEDYYCDQDAKDVHERQASFWKQMKCMNSPFEPPARIVLGLTVKDPRLRIPPRKTTSAQDYEDHNSSFKPMYGSIPDFLAPSPIWERVIRDEVTAKKQPESELNKRRSQLVVPGSELELGHEESKVPVIVIQQPGIDGHGSGWDIIAPLGWGMAFWIAFVYHGARAFGLHQLKTVSRDIGSLLMPYNYPDTEAGKHWEEENRKKMMEKHFRYPPAKRPSFKKLGILAPFFMPWKVLIDDWTKQWPAFKLGRMQPCVHFTMDHQDNAGNNTGNPDTFYVLRSRKQINQLAEVSELLEKLSTQKFVYNCKDANLIKRNLEELETLLSDSSSSLRFSVVGIKLKSVSKGFIKSYSKIYLLDEADMRSLKDNCKYSGPVESIHSVSRDRVKRIKRRKSKCKAKLVEKESETQHVDQGESCSTAIQEKLQRPTIDSLISNCNRKLIGYVESGGYSYFKGCGVGIGHCAFVALLEMFKACFEFKIHPVVLVRAQSSLQYRLAFLSINKVI